MRSLLRELLPSLVLLSIAMAPSAAHAQRDTTITIDAANTVATAPTYRFGRRQSVLLRVTNVNPFVHAYRIVGKETVYAENAIVEFGKTVLGLSIAVPDRAKSTELMPLSEVISLTDKGNGSKAHGKKSALPPAGSYARCSEGTPLLRKLADVAAHVVDTAVTNVELVGAHFVRRARKIRTLANTVDSTATLLRATLRQTDVDSTKVYTAAKTLAGILTAHVDTLRATKPDLEDAAAAFGARVAGTTKLVADFAAAYPSCQYFIVKKSDALRWAADSVTHRAFVARVDDRTTMLTTELTLLRRALTDRIFNVERRFGDVDEPEVFDIRVERATLGDTAWRPIAQPRLQFGERKRFAVSVGLLTSGISTDEFTVVSRIKSASGPAADSTEYRVARTSHVDRSLSPTLALTARLISPSGLVDGVHLVVAGAPHSDGPRSADFFAGLGFSGLDERLLLSVGAVNGVQRTSLDGYDDGARVPATLTTAPVSASRTTKLAAVLAFRVY